MNVNLVFNSFRSPNDERVLCFLKPHKSHKNYFLIDPKEHIRRKSSIFKLMCSLLFIFKNLCDLCG